MHHKLSLIIIPALLATPALAAPKPAKVIAPVLSCKLAGTDGLTYTVIRAGKGMKPSADSKVKVNYKGMLTTDGSKFDEGQGAEFKVGGVIPGFAQGLQLMQAGGSYRLCIPSKLGYGAAGTGGIPANADLVFEVDLLSFTTPPPKPVMPLAERTCDQVTASGLGYRAIKIGSGSAPVDTDVTLVDFITFDSASGKVAEKREWEKIPLAQANPIFAEGLKLMKAGSRYTLCMPTPEGSSADIGPKINIRIDVIDVRPMPTVD